jgi:hypothetical protein
MINLSPLQLSIVQHIELNQAGWWDSTVKRSIMAVLWFIGSKCTLLEIQQLIVSTFSSNWDSKFDTGLLSLINCGYVIQLKHELYELSETGKTEIENIIRASEQICLDARTVFDQLLDDLAIEEDRDLLWEDFNEMFLKPSIKEYGGLALQVFSGGINERSKVLISSYFSCHQGVDERKLEKIVISFISSSDDRVTKYIIGLSISNLCMLASGLDSRTLEKAFNESPKQGREFNCYLDTNFLFSILGLHENPSNAAANALLNLPKILMPYLTVKFLISQETLNEFRLAFWRQIEDLQEIRFSKGIAYVGAETLTGMAKNYSEYFHRTDEPLSPRDYYKPIIDNLVMYLQQKGVEISTDDYSYLRIRQDVIDDILRQQQYEDRQFSDRKKTYKQIEHDIVLWHSVKDKRSSIVESPQDAKYWIITLDYRLLGFDEFKKTLADKIPCCLLPTT